MLPVYQSGIYRDPTRRDVEEEAEAAGLEFWSTTSRDPETGLRVRSFWLGSGVSAPRLLERVAPHVRPHWGEMLKTIGVDWL